MLAAVRNDGHDGRLEPAEETCRNVALEAAVRAMAFGSGGNLSDRHVLPGLYLGDSL